LVATLGEFARQVGTQQSFCCSLNSIIYLVIHGHLDIISSTLISESPLVQRLRLLAETVQTDGALEAGGDGLI